MAKYYNNQKKTGKVAGSVFAIRFGETIERAYNPVVANPKSELQVESRAKLKLISQLAAVLGGNIAIPRVGAKSPRNLFVKKNYYLMGYANNSATIELAAVQVSDSAVSLPAISATRAANVITAALDRPDPNIDRMVYILLVKETDSKLRVFESKVVETAGTDNDYQTSFSLTSLPAVVLGYGIRDNSETARVIFGNLESPSAETIAKLLTSRIVLGVDATLTETRGVNVPAV